MTKLITIKLINGETKEFPTDGTIDYEELITSKAIFFASNGVETLIPLTSVISMEVKDKE